MSKRERERERETERETERDTERETERERERETRDRERQREKRKKERAGGESCLKKSSFLRLLVFLLASFNRTKHPVILSSMLIFACG